MATTVEQVATRVLAAIEANAEKPIGIEIAGTWVSDRLTQILGRTRFRNRRRVGTLTTPATINTGTLTATRGSTTVVADADAQAVLSSAVVGRHLRLATTWYEISAYAAPNLTLVSAYGEPDVADSSYQIVKRFHALAADARWLGAFRHQRLRQALQTIPYATLDARYPSRIYTDGGPLFVAEAQNDSSDPGIKQVELYPYSSVSELINYVYWQAPARLTLSSNIPTEIDPYVLKEGALIDAFRYRMSQEANGNRIEAAGFWRNESRAQETRWERYIQEAARTDRGVDDQTFIVNYLGSTVGYGREVIDAHDEVWIRGRP